MSDEYEDFDAETEDALDELLGQYQDSLLSSVESVLDTNAGFGQAMASMVIVTPWSHDVRRAESEDEVTRTVRFFDSSEDPRFVWTKVPSEALHASLDAIRYEAAQLEDLAEEIESLPGICPAPPSVRVPPGRAVRMTLGELRRISELLGSGSVTKQSVPREFNGAEQMLKDQGIGWGQTLVNARYKQRREMVRERWLSESFMTRLDGLLLLRERIIKLFEDAPQGAYQVS
ncbi:hypothetical protein ACFWHQ_22350 [Streptomyces sp. NPDC060334]|uniref:hypothetical protein n=1 Tax=Streptomyces sp. NPDC060334 TaxID=3347099 RepID=UPI00364842CE